MQFMQNVLIIQPPVLQLNTAYPSGAYLSSFFKKTGCNVTWIDLNIELFHSLFSKTGLEKLFKLSFESAAKKAEDFEKEGNSEAAFNLRRYLSQKKLWINNIDFFKAVLTNNFSFSGFEKAHSILFSPHFPRGSRMEAFVASKIESGSEITTDDARSLASMAFADLSDFINVAFDQNFSLVRYAEHLTVSENSFGEISKGADSPVLKEFLIPVLEKIPFENDSAPDLICISVPFAGTFAAALTCGRFFKQKFNDKVPVSFGGGFINTELRECDEVLLKNYCDILSFDRGYADYEKLIGELESGTFRQSEKILRLEGNFEKDTFWTKKIIPDFSDIDFSKYPRMTDDTNPMHRLWSDGAWIKAYMAHGCYWHKCAFCDVTLDYVKSYCLTDIHSLYEGLLEQCQKKGIYGIHFVDEAMPPAAMIEFAKENILHGSPVSWWGNVRFEKFFTRDIADFLSAGGLIGVSAGLESATGNGLEAIHKGTDLQSIVSACCAFKEAGILVHAYMIYGYWFEKPEDLMNSMETLRQFYQAGILDSSFWHKFVLTRHSRVFNEWKNGQHPELVPLGYDDEGNSRKPLFAKNGLHFKGEEKSEKYGPYLEAALNCWMHGQGLNKNIARWFPFPVPQSNVPKDFIERKIENYEKNRDELWQKKFDEKDSFWIGGEKIPSGKGKITWFYMGEKYEAKKDSPSSFFRGKGLVVLK